MRECACPGCRHDALPGDEFCTFHVYEAEVAAERMWAELEPWLAKVNA